MKTLLKIILASLLFTPALALATTAVPWSITNISDTYIFPNVINGSAKGVVISASSTINGNLSVSSLTSGNCVQTSTGGLLTTTGTACATSSAFPFTPQSYGNSTTSIIAFLNGMISNGSTTVSNLGSGLVGANNGHLYGAATSTLTPSSPLTGSFTQVGTGGAIGCQTASGSQAGCLSSTDWTTFNNKSGFGYLFPILGIGTTTGLMITASSTVGDGSQVGGLTISGGATTTGIAYFVSNVGIGSTSPFAKLSVQAASTDTNRTLFAIGSSTISATTTLFTISNTGVVNILQGTALKPTLVFGNSTNSGFYSAVPGSSIDVTLAGSNRAQFSADYFKANGTGGITTNAQGTGALPSYTWGADNTTGLFLDTTGGSSLGFAAGGVERARIAPAGNFGIGTTSPYAKLSVHANAGESNQFVFAIGSSTASATSTLLSVNNIGKLTVPFASTTAATASSELNIPHSGTVPTLTSGDLYANTNSTASSSLATNDGSNTHTQFFVHSVSKPIASSTLSTIGSYGSAGTTTILIANPIHSSTIQSAYCKTDVGTANVVWGNGSATTTTLVCTTAGAQITFSTNNTWLGRQNVFMAIGDQTSSPNIITPTADVEDSN